MQVRSAAEWKTIVQDWRKSGLTQAEYGRKHKIKSHTLSYWHRKIPLQIAPENFPVKENGSNEISFSEFIPDPIDSQTLTSQPMKANKALIIETSYGARIEVPL